MSSDKGKLGPIDRLALAFPTPAWSVATLVLWYENLADLDQAVLDQAVRGWVRSRCDRPTIADIRCEVTDLQLRNAEGTDQVPEPGKAWGYVVAQITCTGRYRGFPDRYPLIARVVNRIGWETLCGSDNPEADRAHFLRLYAEARQAALRAATKTPGATMALPGKQAARPRLEAPDGPVRRVLQLVKPVEPVAPAPAEKPEIEDAEVQRRREERRVELRRQATEAGG